MLNVMLMRDREEAMLEATRAWLTADRRNVFTLVLDELHTYRGTPGTEVAYPLRKLLARLGLSERPEQLSIVAAPASLDATREEDLAYLAGFFAQPPERFAVIEGQVRRPEGPPDLRGASRAARWLPSARGLAAR